MILSFRSLEDTLLTPIATLDIAASPDMIAKGLITYADPLHAAAHIYSVVTDGMTLGLFWLYAILWNGGEAVDMSTARSFTLTTLNVFKSWLSLCNIRLVVLLFQVGGCCGSGLLDWRMTGLTKAIRRPPSDAFPSLSNPHGRPW